MIEVNSGDSMKTMNNGEGTNITTAESRNIVYEDVYSRLFNELITGQLEPGKALTVRGLATELGVSPMPVREAVKRLVAQGALTMTQTRRVMVAPMTDARFEEIGLGRTLLEPELAVRALANFTSHDIGQIERLDAQLDKAIEQGDTSNYGRFNWGFHSYIYNKANMSSLYALVESLGLQVGPFMRLAVGRYGTSNLDDQHELAIKAFKNKDPTMLAQAIRQDILDGINLIRPA
jgi:DNA-binding GntR family transcriptional regulator